ncbi:MAG TPA: hypothetical protein DDX39_10030 [Bacteroidales bacterium]|nr:MAG: hypothetical protein A2W98_01345 [Bacteroidetes bacterium GWF2_33_38]OFY75182.1 MAG: hypothetical protein A2265_05205 [Bacteroidetes bacterium RIFOXYA12_FULL_33_9]OFY88976.1 MAG: hypothetical protein A2236_04290 [Bacteroidetes bacterium RIFOXYA2_FULL_33_7]HBF88968.1 hypothetical protein [Bacteroidales bacterium]
MDWILIIGVIAVGFAAGFINTIAGGGSALTLPFLIFLGLPANIANGTNRIGILMQNVVATSSFKKHQKINIKHATILAIPSVVGAIIGAQFASVLDENIMEKAIGIALILMLGLIVYKPEKWIQESIVFEKPGFLQIIYMFLVGLYGGFIQIGAGFFMLATLVIGVGYDLVRANAAKVYVMAIYTFFALGVFVLNNQIDYTLGLVLAVGNMIGGWIGAKAALKLGTKFIRYFLIITILVSAIKLFIGF